jgi:SnoaL-like protein
MGVEMREPMVDLTSHGVSVALLLGTLLAGGISGSAFRSEAAQGARDAARRQAMSDGISTLLTRNLYDVFGENDPKRRRAAIDEMFTEDCVFYEPGGGVYRGRDEIDRVSGALRATHPDFRYQPIAEPEVVGNGGRVQWVEGRPGEPPAHAGTDFIVARDGRIATVYLFFDKLP